MTDSSIQQLPDHPDLHRLEAESAGLLERGSCATPADALQRVAERYGFPGWPQLKDYVDSIGTMGALEQAIQDDDDNRVKALLTGDPGLVRREGHWVRRRRHNGYLPLAYAAFFGKVKVMEALIAAGADVRAGGDKALRAAACFDDNLPAVELLIGHGADPNASTVSPSGRPYRVIDYPCMTLAAGMIRRLAALGGELSPDNAGMVIATNERRPRDKADCLRVFEEAGFKLPDTAPMAVHLRDFRLLECHLRNDPHMASRLYPEHDVFPPGFGIKQPAPYATVTPLSGGVTLLHMAVECCDVETAKWLLGHGADVNAAAGTDADGFGGWTPLFHAMATLHVPRNFPDMAELLLDRGADPAIRASIRKPASDGEEAVGNDVTALEYARDFIYPDLVNQDALRLVTQAVEAGGDSG